MFYEEIIILHEYGAPAHYIGLVENLRRRGNDKKIRFYEFNIAKRILKSIVKLDKKLFFRSIRNLLWLSLTFIYPQINENKVIVIGMAPLDWRIIIISRITKYARKVYHSSWTDWSGNDYPKKNVIFGVFFEKKWRAFLSNEVGAVAAVTEKTSSEIEKFTRGQTKFKSVVVYHSFDNVFSDNNKKSKPGNKPKGLGIIYIGRLVKQKGIDKIIELAKVFPSHQFTIVGSGELLPSLEQSNLKNINIAGFVSDKKLLAEICSSNDIILLPSIRISGWEELFGISLIEAMSVGCIPIVSDHLGPKEILDKNTLLRTYVLAEDDYVKEAINIIHKLENDSDLLNVYREASCICASNFSLSEVSKKWGVVLNYVLNNRS
ncbi:TPA: glycosyltransferase family 4 protein [Klebsiella quasipneumoniae]|uniref:glycosyltransferase family 4 protein n=1 Tax=Klebsiella quasipneumoniae TaxID=1463165 RepID=UPI00237EDC98|nr:glycosyltransferase family 4 protein [Klebsiella quasipneumoniae]MDL2151103.1 glycosyltransferase family 4 protein [Klebsiella quasipneumoniae]HDC4344245.1 glycosyltransferase family 4 protein [Klebsiella quasipneumoniae]